MKMERLNDILGYKNRKIYQNDNFFSFSLDSIILANFVNIRKNDRKICDLCTGNAVIPLILSLRTDKHIDGVEIQEEIYNLGEKSIKYNNLCGQINLFNEDINSFCGKHIEKYNIVTCNPPYFRVKEDSNKNISVEKMIARHEVKTNLDEVCKISSKILYDKGTFALIHRTDRFVEVIETLKKYKLEPKRIMFIYNKLDSTSEMFFVESRKNGSCGLKIEKPFIMRNDDNTYTDEYNKIILDVRK